jgi:biopolymer transport protein ExbD
MRLPGFDSKKILPYCLFYMACCGQVVSVKSQNIDLALPQKETPALIKQVDTIMTVILINESLLYCYYGSVLSKGKRYQPAEFDTLLEHMKKKWGENFLILLKPTKRSSYKTTVDALDQMTIHKIKRFAMVALSKPEEDFLYSANLLPASDSLAIEPPVTMERKTILINEPAFYVYLKENSTIWYKVDSTFNKDNYVKLNKEQTLEKLIEQYKIRAQQANKKTYVYIVGDEKTTYPNFERVISALKKNEIYKYNLLTTDN